MAEKVPARNRAAVLGALGNLSWTRYRLRPTEAGSELSRAITMFESILTVRSDLIPESVLDALVRASAPEAAEPPDDDPDAGVQHAALLLGIVAHIDRPDLLDEAIERLKTAFGSVRPETLHAGIRADLGLALVRRFQNGGSRTDLDDAVEAYRSALAQTPGDGSDRITILSNLGVALRYRFERFGALADLDEAVETGRRSVETAAGDDGTASFNLSATLRLRFQVSGRTEDLVFAVAAGRTAIENLGPVRTGT